MDLPAGINRRYASIAVFILVALWCWVAFDRPYVFPYHIPWNIYSNAPQSPLANDIFDFPLLKSSAIKSVCSDTLWNSSVTFMCDDSSGGVPEVRNSILNCVRYTIAAGGSLVLPRIILRDAYEDLDVGNTTELEYMFDTDHFINSLTVSCPQLQIHKTASTIPYWQHAYGPISLVPESLVKNIPKTGISHPEEWRGLFYKWLSQYVSEDTKGPLIIRLGRSYLQYPIDADGGTFALHFGQILKIRSDVRNLATMALSKFTDAYNLRLDLHQPILKKAFLAAYLNTAVDVPKDDQANAKYETQSRLSFEQAQSLNISLIYAASELEGDISQFRTDAARRNISVTTKLDLLKGKDREYLMGELTPDQQALVDWLVMSKATFFTGVGHCSLAWNIALKRHQFTTQKAAWLDGPQVFSDSLSQVFGPVGGHPEFPACMWP